MATYTNTAKYALRWLTGSNLVSDIDAGFQSLAEDIDSKMAGYAEGTAASRPAAGVAGRLYGATDIAGELARDIGSAWVSVSPGYGSALPTSNLYDGQRFIYTADAANGVRWELRYNAGGGTYKWEVIGGGALYTEIAASESISGGTYAAAATNPGPTVTVPLEGVYDITVSLEFEFLMTGSPNYGAASVKWAAGTAQDADRVMAQNAAAAGAGSDFHTVSRTIRRAGIVATFPITVHYRSTNALAARRSLQVRPVRVI